MKRLLAVLLLGVFSLGGCTSAGPAVLKIEYPKAPRYEVMSENPAEKDFIENLRQFGVTTGSDILSQGEGNCLYSPVSLYYALAMSAEGSNGKTREEFSDFLGMDCTEDFAASCGQLYRRMYCDEEGRVLRIANSVWMKKGYPFLQTYQEQMKENYYASLYTVDFAAKETSEQMGKWISEQTGGLLGDNYSTDPTAVMAILNTVWLKDAWQDKFSGSMTEKDVFVRADGEEVECSFMHRTEHNSVWMGDGWIRARMQLSELGNVFFVLPTEEGKLQELLENADQLEEAMYGAERQMAEIHWSVPKLKAECTLALTDYLSKKLGSAFGAGADFSAMTPNGILISSVKQKLCVEWDEEGVEAAAYTEVYKNESAMVPPKDPLIVEMDLNRPFLYGIETWDGVSLFIGVCQDPTVAEAEANPQ